MYGSGFELLADALKDRPEGIFFMIFMSIIFSVLQPLISSQGNIMIRLKKAISIILFLYPFKKKVSIWSVILQICNYIVLICAVIVFKVINITSYEIVNLFGKIISYYIGLIFILIVIDGVVYDIKSKKTF